MKTKQQLYKTAVAVFGCADFSAGEIVGFDPAETWLSPSGVWWYTIRSSERGKLKVPAPYPEDHLREFCL